MAQQFRLVKYYNLPSSMEEDIMMDIVMDYDGLHGETMTLTIINHH